MKYILDLNDRPFKAIKAGTKKIEGRTPTSWDKTPYDELQKCDLVGERGIEPRLPDPQPGGLPLHYSPI